MIAHELPLLKLFNELREAGLPLGIDEYQLLLRSLQAGFGISDLASLARLCRTLWVKSQGDFLLFNNCFEQVMPQEGSSKMTFTLQETEFEPAEKKPTALPSKPLAGASTPTPALTMTSEVITKTTDEIRVVQSILPIHSQEEEPSSDHFTLTDEYFPITRRQMKQSWRYMRRPIREGAPTELDVEATVSEVGRQGMLLEPVLRAPRINRAEVLILIDSGGSMVPFHELSRRLVETALRGGRLGSVHIYYFHNCPTRYLYFDSTRVEARPIEDVLNELRNKRIGVLIISDAGAARGGYSQDRIALTEDFLDQLKEQFLYIAWLNPMPVSRWTGTTAEEVMHLMPMLEMSRQGVDDAIRILRGRSTHVKAQLP